jgi:hypothetical protein
LMLATTDQAMRFNPDMSVRWREHLEFHGITYEKLLEHDPDRTLAFEAVVEDVRDLMYEDKPWHVVYTPMPEDVVGCSHASVLVMRDIVTPKSGDLRRFAREMLRQVFVHSQGDCDLEFPEDHDSTPEG